MELPAGLIALRKLVSIGAIANGTISSLAVLPGVMQSRLEFLILTKGLEFYRDRLCHELVWRNDAVDQVGLRLPTKLS
jgi:hypothetical protein